MPKAKKENKQNKNATVARSDDKTIQITFTIPFSDIKSAREKVARDYSDKVNIPGFRPGKAPLDKVLEKIPQETLIEKSLSSILPELLNSALIEHKIIPAIYPKFEVISAEEEKDWQIRATTCELPKVDLSDYKKELPKAAKASAIWTPGKDKKDEVKTKTREEKEQEVIKYLLESTKIDISRVLIEEEVNSKLSQLLERIEKLGLSLESYLTSTGKNAETLRNEYENQAKSAISLDLILSKIAEEEKLEVDKKDIDAAINAAGMDKSTSNDFDTPERRRFIEVILKRRKALDFLTSLI